MGEVTSKIGTVKVMIPDRQADIGIKLGVWD
jgi:hypothetical protein